MRKCYTIVHMRPKGIPNKAHMPEENKRKAFISIRVKESEKELITREIGDNNAIRLFLLEYLEKRKHELE